MTLRNIVATLLNVFFSLNCFMSITVPASTLEEFNNTYPIVPPLQEINELYYISHLPTLETDSKISFDSYTARILQEFNKMFLKNIPAPSAPTPAIPYPVNAFSALQQGYFYSAAASSTAPSYLPFHQTLLAPPYARNVCTTTIHNDVHPNGPCPYASISTQSLHSQWKTSSLENSYRNSGSLRSTR